MCGIAGIVRLDSAPVDAAGLHRMAALQTHRGPDGQGFAAFPRDHTALPRLWREPAQVPVLGDCPVGLAFRRLAILDLTEAGHQPMGTPDGRYWVVFNGEIYNHVELRRELEASGASFRSRTDTEVLLAAWSAWGERCLERMEGMFAFGILDRPGQRLFLARDRFGIKPLYWAEHAGGIAFASEIKPVLAGLGMPARPSTAAAHDLLVRGRKDHRETTFFEGVQQLPPAHLLTVKARAAPPRAYYDLSDAVRRRMADLPEAPEARTRLFREALEATVRSHLRSDVPVGTCLSGGLDSSAIVCLVAAIRADLRTALGATPASDGRFHTFSARSADPALDEGRYMDAVTRHTGLPNHAVIPGPAGFFDDLPDLLWHQEEPFQGGSPYAQWMVMREASASGVKVLLDGQGADEILGGYPGTAPSAVADDLARLRWGRALSTWRHSSLGGAKGLAAAGLALVGVRAPRRASPLLSQELRSAGTGSEPPRDLPTRLRSERRALVSWHLPALLHYEDRNSMAHSLEARVPFLDRRLVELALALPAEDLLGAGWSKRILREAVAADLPEGVRSRRDKIGFATPDASWMAWARQDRLPAFLNLFTQDPSPWIDWRAARALPDIPLPLLLTELWRRQATSRDYLEPRGTALSRG